ncbi:hypothetical protein JZ751_001387, partial [Albula glossodonta]
ALLADLESSTSHISKRPVFLPEETPYSYPTGGHTYQEVSIPPPVPPPPSAEALNGTVIDPPSHHSSQQSFGSAQKSSWSRDSSSPPPSHGEEDHVYSKAVPRLSPTEEAAPPLPSCSTTHFVQENGGSAPIKVPPPTKEKPKRNGSRGIEDVRPSVESLLDELESSVPSPTPTPSAVQNELADEQLESANQQQARISASSATRELDELMASLSDFKPSSLGSLNSEPLLDQVVEAPAPTKPAAPASPVPSLLPAQSACDSPLPLPPATLELHIVEEAGDSGVTNRSSVPATSSVGLAAPLCPSMPSPSSAQKSKSLAQEGPEPDSVIDVSASMLSSRLESLVVLSSTTVPALNPSKAASPSGDPPAPSSPKLSPITEAPSCPVSSTLESTSPQAPAVDKDPSPSPVSDHKPSTPTKSPTPPVLSSPKSSSPSPVSTKSLTPPASIKSSTPPPVSVVKSSTPSPVSLTKPTTPPISTKSLTPAHTFTKSDNQPFVTSFKAQSPPANADPKPVSSPAKEKQSEKKVEPLPSQELPVVEPSLDEALDNLLAMSFSEPERGGGKEATEVAPLQEVHEEAVLATDRSQVLPDMHSGEEEKRDLLDWIDMELKMSDDGREGTITPLTEASWMDESLTPSSCPGTPDTQLDLPLLQPSAVERISASGHIKSVIRRTKETSNVHPMYREGHHRRKLGPIIFNKSNSQDRLIEELQGKLGIGRHERWRKQQDDWLTEGVIVMSKPQRTREERPVLEVDKIIIPPESPVPQRKVILPPVTPPLSPPAPRRPLPVEEPKKPPPVKQIPPPLPPPPPPPSPPPQPPQPSTPQQPAPAPPLPAPIPEPPCPKPQSPIKKALPIMEPPLPAPKAPPTPPPPVKAPSPPPPKVLV